MTAEEYEKDVLPDFVKALSKAFLDAEEKHPGGMKAWMESLAEGRGRKPEDEKQIPHEQHGIFHNEYRTAGLCLCYACVDFRRDYWSENQK